MSIICDVESQLGASQEGKQKIQAKRKKYL